MKALKDSIADMIHHLPATATVEDIQYQLYTFEKIRKGRQSIQSGKCLSHKEAKTRLRKWLDA